jgi:hypothetical protein
VKLDFAMLARAVDVNNGEFFIHGGTIRLVKAEAFPAVVPIAIATRLIGDHSEIGSHHTLALKLFGPDEVVPFFESPALDFTLDLPAADASDPEIAVAFGVSLGGVPFQREGLHIFELELDGAHLVSLELRARLVPGSAIQIGPAAPRAQDTAGG